MVTDLNPLHLKKAPLPIEVTELGMVTEVKPLSSSQRPAGITFTPSPKVNVLIFNKLAKG
jgi:hypothetical protein